jgi:hypothetical protein
MARVRIVLNQVGIVIGTIASLYVMPAALK